MKDLAGEKSDFAVVVADLYTVLRFLLLFSENLEDLDVFNRENHFFSEIMVEISLSLMHNCRISHLFAKPHSFSHHQSLFRRFGYREV